MSLINKTLENIRESNHYVEKEGDIDTPSGLEPPFAIFSENVTDFSHKDPLKIEYLEIWGSTIFVKKDLAEFKNLKTLILKNCIVDLDGIEKLNHLLLLSFEDSTVGSLSYIENIITLRILSLNGTTFSKLERLQKLVSYAHVTGFKIMPLIFGTNIIFNNMIFEYNPRTP